KAAVAAEKFDRYCALEIKEVIDLALIEVKDRDKELKRHTIHIGPMRHEAQEALSELRNAINGTENSGLDDGEGARLVASAADVYAGIPPIEERIIAISKVSKNNEPAAVVIKNEYLPQAREIL